MVLRSRFFEFAEALVEVGLEVGRAGLEGGEVGGEGEVLLLDEGAVLLRVDVGGVGARAERVELVEEATDVGVGLRRHRGGVAGAPRELLVGEEQGHRLCPNRKAIEREKEEPV